MHFCRVIRQHGEVGDTSLKKNVIISARLLDFDQVLAELHRRAIVVRRSVSDLGVITAEATEAEISFLSGIEGIQDVEVQAEPPAGNMGS